MDLVRELEGHLAAEDEQLRSERLDRAVFLVRLGTPEHGLMLLNGDAVIGPWNELRWDYVQGCYQSSLLVGQAFLENLLGGVVQFHHQAGDRPGLPGLLVRARRLGWLLPSEFEELQRSGRVRNPYTHYRSFTDEDSLTSRSLALGVPPESLRKADCERFLVALHSFVYRRFGLGQTIVPSDDELLPQVHPNQLALCPV